MERRIILLWLGSLWVAMSSVNCVYMVGDREVMYFWQAKNWFTAYEMCRAQGKHLLTIHSDEENIQIMRIAADYCSDAADEFRKQCRGEGFWPAATDLGQYRKFVWMDSGSQVETTWWAPGQPDNFFFSRDERCLEISYFWQYPRWNDVGCFKERPYFCEKKPQVGCNSE